MTWTRCDHIGAQEFSIKATVRLQRGSPNKEAAVEPALRQKGPQPGGGVDASERIRKGAWQGAGTLACVRRCVAGTTDAIVCDGALPVTLLEPIHPKLSRMYTPNVCPPWWSGSPSAHASTSAAASW